jgi:hypothetical protein
MDPICWAETSARYYLYTPRNNPEDSRSHLLRGRSLKSHKGLESEHFYDCPRLYTDDVRNSTHLNAIFDKPAFRYLTKEHSTFYGTLTSKILNNRSLHIHTGLFRILFNIILSSYQIVDIRGTLKR